MTVATRSPNAPRTATELTRLYAARFVFAVTWAVVVAVLGSSLSAGVVTLLVVYPLVDVAAAVVDLRTTRNPALYANIVISAVAAVAVAVAAADDVAAVLRVWGAWAVLAGLTQLVVAVRRRILGGQWPMVVAGGISLLAGAGFVAGAGSATSVRMVAGYATLGGLFFLASAVRLRQRAGTRTAAACASVTPLG